MLRHSVQAIGEQSPPSRYEYRKPPARRTMPTEGLLRFLRRAVSVISFLHPLQFEHAVKHRKRHDNY